ncbi:hypothetical protein BIU82_14080 [Arthrobacter sp. SW1]|nr:hypothetical protein BIU82_14080 [Arthrobacter sp. SW1]
MTGPEVYPLAMIELPDSYQAYLDGQAERTIQAVRPILMQSAADQLHGVRITYNPGATGHQAHLDESLPYGTIVEDID